MKRIALALAALLGATTALWLASDAGSITALTYTALRGPLIQFSGIVALTVMCVSVLLALRPVRLESALGGLDKMYRLHKWLGITGLTFAVIHWLTIKAPGWLTTLGLMARQARRQGGRPPAQATSAIVSTLRSLKHPAETVGEWTFYALALLVVLALVKKFPYRWFQKTHRLLAVALALFVFHAVVLMKITYWTLPVGPVMALLWLASLVAVVIVLARQVGARRRASAEVVAVEPLPESQSVAVTLRVDERWKGQSAGQFAFVSFASAPEPHPYTVASAWSDKRELRFVIKALGDHTATLVQAVKVGDRATVEGPYGRFNFASDKPRQLWIAGGIGITPFLAKLRELAASPEKRPVDLFFCAKAADASLLDELRRHAASAAVTLHVLIEGKDGRLDAERIAATVPEWKQGDLWFCGPEAFGNSLRSALAKRGLESGDFHSELFVMR